MRRSLALAFALFACKPAPPQPAAPPPDAGELAADSKALLAEVDKLKDQLRDRPKTFEILTALGNLYYENGRYLEAVDSYREALELARPVEALQDELRARRVKPAASLPAECRRAGPEYGLTQIFDAARKLPASQELRCLDGALEMAIAARARRGNSLYLVGNADGALAEHRKVLERAKDYPESLFFVGAILLEQSQGDKAKLAEGKRYWKRLLEVAPDHPRAPLVRDSLPRAEEIFAPKPEAQLPAGHPKVAGGGGQGELPEGHPDIRGGKPAGVDPEALRNVQNAVESTPRTPELEKGIDEQVNKSDALLDQGKYQEARDALVPVMPYRTNDAHTAANLGAAMRGLGRMEMAERTLGHALQLDPKQPRALYELAKLDAQRGNKAAAIDRLNAVKAASPQFARAHDVDGELRKLR